MVKSNESTFDDLPDDMFLLIISKVYDLKTLCICELVSKHFHRTVLQVEVISFTSVIDPIVIPPNMEPDLSVSFTLLIMPFELAMFSLKKFKSVKSLNIKLLSSPNNPLLNKWILIFDIKRNEFVFFSADYVCHKKDLYPKDEIDYMDLRDAQYKTLSRCFVDSQISHCRLLQCGIKILPLLENISITDLGKRRTISYNGEHIIAMRDILTLPFEKFKHKYYRREQLLIDPCVYESYSVGFLKLPISGYNMINPILRVRKRDDLHDHLRLVSTHILEDDFVEDKAINEILERLLN